MIGVMNKTLMATWIVLSVGVVGGFFAIMYLLMFREVVVGHEQEWKFIEMMFGGLVTVFGQILHSWMSWFVGPTHTESKE